MAKVIETKAPETAAEEEFKAELEQEQEKEEVKQEPKATKDKTFIECKQNTLMNAVTMMDGLLSDVVITIDEETGLTASAMDQANVAMIVLDLKPSEFTAIKGKAKVGIKVSTLKGMLKRAKADDNIRMTFSNPIELVFASKFNKTFTLPQIDIEDDEDKELPTLQHEAEFEMDTALLVETLEDCGQVAEALTLEVKDGRFNVFAKGDTSGYSGEVTEVKGNDCNSKFAKEYMVKMVKGIAERVTVKLGKDYPLVLEYGLGKESKITLLLAPRVEQE